MDERRRRARARHVGDPGTPSGSSGSWSPRSRSTPSAAGPDSRWTASPSAPVSASRRSTSGGPTRRTSSLPRSGRWRWTSSRRTPVPSAEDLTVMVRNLRDSYTSTDRMGDGPHPHRRRRLRNWGRRAARGQRAAPGHDLRGHRTWRRARRADAGNPGPARHQRALRHVGHLPDDAARGTRWRASRRTPRSSCSRSSDFLMAGLSPWLTDAADA